MAYFRDFPFTRYKFGNEVFDVLTQDITAYVDIIDDIKDVASFYQEYYILEGDRPDNLSQRMYGTPDYYFTYYLMNDNIRQCGWPLTQKTLDAKVKEDFPHFTVTTQDDMTGIMLPGSSVLGQTSGASGTVKRRNLDLGQLIIEPTNEFKFQKNELVVILDEFNNVTQSVVSTAATEQWQSIRHYINGDKEQVDIDPHQDPPGTYTPVLYSEWYKEQNDALRQIRILRPSAITSIMRSFKEAMRG